MIPLTERDLLIRFGGRELTTRQMADVMGFPDVPSALWTILRRLEKKGLAQRTRKGVRGLSSRWIVGRQMRPPVHLSGLIRLSEVMAPPMIGVKVSQTMIDEVHRTGGGATYRAIKKRGA